MLYTPYSMTAATREATLAKMLGGGGAIIGPRDTLSQVDGCVPHLIVSLFFVLSLCSLCLLSVLSSVSLCLCVGVFVCSDRFVFVCVNVLYDFSQVHSHVGTRGFCINKYESNNNN